MTFTKRFTISQTKTLLGAAIAELLLLWRRPCNEAGSSESSESYNEEFLPVFESTAIEQPYQIQVNQMQEY